MGDCKGKCVNEGGINCQSIDYNSQSKDCHISEARSDSGDYTEPCYLDGWQYTELLIDADKRWSKIKYACIRSNNYKTFNGILTMGDCKGKCVNEGGINCQSIDYNSQSKDCHISEARSDSGDYTEPCYLDGWQYTELLINADKRWSKIKYACIRSNNYKTFNGILTMGDCKGKCVNEGGINCQSIDYNSQSKDCHISEARSDSGDYTEPCYLDGWQYTELLIDAGK
ncbi:unnamed protein product [Meganyctiphanes norvegica]|uniref:Apple domain-containing protein n=1 Tax=Meganyctiphanes norvegica TaxID=48144 RepID=A0AAV2SP56_MEGNR